MSKNNVVAFPSQVATTEHKNPVVAAMDRVFGGLLRNAQVQSEFSPTGKGIQYGPYGQQIFYLTDGSVRHLAGLHIDALRDKRAYTLNAVEYRCDALGLAVYVSGVTQLKNGSEVTSQARIVVYDFKQLEPTGHYLVGSADALVTKLHTVLMSTFNRLSREYNLAGFRAPFLTLVTKVSGYPDVNIDLAASPK